MKEKEKEKECYLLFKNSKKQNVLIKFNTVKSAVNFGKRNHKQFKVYDYSLSKILIKG
jgi:hypothetical protein